VGGGDVNRVNGGGGRERMAQAPRIEAEAKEDGEGEEGQRGTS